MRSRAGFFWHSLWLTLLLLLPLIAVVAFLARQRQAQQELRQAAASQSQLQIEPGAQSVWRMLLVVQQEEPAFVLVRADGPAHSVTFCALPGQLLVNAPAGTTTLAACTLSAGAGRAAQLLTATLATGETALPPLYYLAATPSCWVDCVGSGTAVRFDTSSLLQPAARLALGYGSEAVQSVSATDTVEFIAALQSQLTGSAAGNARAAVWAAFVRQNPDLLTAVPEAWRRYSARTLTDLTAQDLLRAGETAAFLQSQPALTVDYLTAAVTDAPDGVALTEDGMQIVQTLLR
ncbi:MAG: hypothetical protein PUJ48_11685 [Subdoligranulum variabile]|uniref:hypothetical protein n=1 Tax=Gemmiger sp. TaxID=2049027 RepID=UPI002A82CC75|nr:hypothetical protein [Gemmiger sp.]MCI6141525.1 hypothetical protein [Subdoligranulum variabile]MCI6383851.1 hypothetical protein [Subdoligranulum variabile]MCI7641796.1 hypothetical protein [Subdoligranulum variabile]MDD6424922.1 hypothetical protein [Subdoligranulum variabile]MDD7640839.1 hypothetical protein [Subdoligranulum variabile]